MEYKLTDAACLLLGSPGRGISTISSIFEITADQKLEQTLGHSWSESCSRPLSIDSRALPA